MHSLQVLEPSDCRGMDVPKVSRLYEDLAFIPSDGIERSVLQNEDLAGHIDSLAALQ